MLLAIRSKSLGLKQLESGLPEAEDNSACGLKIIQRLASSDDSSRNASHIAEGALVFANFVTEVKAKGEVMREEKLQAASQVAGESRLAAVWTRFHQVGIKLGGFVVVGKRELAPRSADARGYIGNPSVMERGKMIDVVDRCRKWIGDAEFSGMVIAEIVEYATADGTPCFYL